MTTNYRVQMIDSETPAPWMGLPCVVSFRPTGQEGEYCWFDVETSDAPALETALDADDDVVKYKVA